MEADLTDLMSAIVGAPEAIACWSGTPNAMPLA